jgi:anhydro-N-acetylmuramic acid kinase
MRVLGFMTGTSLDAVDMAVIETDGREIAAFGPAGERDLTEAARAIVMQATVEARGWPRGSAPPPSFAAASAAVAREHFEAAEAFLRANGMRWSDLDLIGMHGQTVLHERPKAGARGRTVQLGDAAWLAKQARVRVAHDFRAADVADGGQGAPIAPIYHAALARRAGLEAPLTVLNLGGVANVTMIADGELTAFDTGPANGMIDQWLQAKTGARYDVDGRLAAAGAVDDAALAAFLRHPYFAETGPKSLDRFDFALDPVAHLSLEDGAATLTAFAAEALAHALRGRAGALMIACGGGRRNPALMAAIRARTGLTVKAAEDVGWRGDSVEAEAIAFLAARRVNDLPITFPGTTGVAAPMTGGRIVEP